MRPLRPTEARDEGLARFRLPIGRRRGAARALDHERSRFGRSAGQIPERRRPIQGYLTKPKGAGPFPAVVLLHSCLGLPANRRAMADTFAGWGYVALFVDDFATRGVKETCAVDFPAGRARRLGRARLSVQAPLRRPGQDRRDRLLAGRRHRAQDRFVPPRRRFGRRGRSAVQSRGGLLSAVRKRSEREARNPDPHSGRRDGRRDARGGLRAARGETAGARRSSSSSIRARATDSTIPSSRAASGFSACGSPTIATPPSGRGRNCARSWRRGSLNDAGVG